MYFDKKYQERQLAQVEFEKEVQANIDNRVQAWTDILVSSKNSLFNFKSLNPIRGIGGFQQIITPPPEKFHYYLREDREGVGLESPPASTKQIFLSPPQKGLILI